MKGTGTAHAAVSFVNALPTGTGCAAAIDLPVTAVADVETGRGSGSHGLRIDPSSDTPLVRSSVAAALEEVGKPADLGCQLTIHSAVPAGKGLKSSSAVSVAVLKAVAAAVERPLTPLRAAELSTRVGRSVGVSATGAFDDALAASRGGVVVTDNLALRLLSAGAVPTDWCVVAWLADGTHSPSTEWREAFRDEAVEGRRAVDSALAGRFEEAMERNTRLVERVMGYEYAELRARLRRAGAICAGVTGLGPALVAIVRSPERPAVEAEFPPGSVVCRAAFIGPAGPVVRDE